MTISYQDFSLIFTSTDEQYQYYVNATGPQTETTTPELIDMTNLFSYFHEHKCNDPKTIGRMLYELAFHNEIKKLFEDKREKASRNGYGLRVNLQLIDVPELNPFCWETLHDNVRHLTLDPLTPVIRSVRQEGLRERPDLQHPLRILVTISLPRDLEVVKPESLYLENIRNLIDLRLDYTPHATLDELRQKLDRVDPFDVWHFIGHGGFDHERGEGSLAFCDSHRQSHNVSASLLAQIMGIHSYPQFVYLSACEGAKGNTENAFSSVANALVQQGIPSVLAMRQPVTDTSANALAEEFYTKWIEGKQIDEAITHARRRLIANKPPQVWEWTTPIHVRANTDSTKHPNTDNIKKEKVVVATKTIPAGLTYYEYSEENGKREFIDSFDMSVSPITNAQYVLFLEANPDYAQPSNWKYDRTPPQDIVDHPVTFVNLHDAKNFCKWLSRVTGDDWRLPTDPEWVRAGRKDFPDKRLFPWGTKIDPALCNCKQSSYGHTTAVNHYGKDGESPYGIQDLIGNVFEWVDTQYKPENDLKRYIIRGGSFDVSIDDLSLAYFGRKEYDSKRGYLGFRVVKSVR